jgi:CRISPR-associated protein Csx14
MREHRLTLDPRNPGQFFACCGLFELSELIAPGGEAWFGNEGQEFTISADVPLPPQDLRLELPADLEGKPYDATLEPLELAIGKRKLTLNWWLNDTLADKSPLKTWGGQQTPRRILHELLRLLDFSIPFESLPQSSAYTKSRFGVDARSAWEALGAGYSPNDVGQDATTFPWVEVLAVAGIQGFRPAKESRSCYRYSTWLTPLTLATARAACAAPWPGLPSRSFSFQIAGRGQGYKTFLFAEGVNEHV